MPDTNNLINQPGQYRVLLVLPNDDIEQANVLEGITNTIQVLDAAGVGDNITLQDAVLLEAADEETFVMLNAQLFSRLGVTMHE